MQYRGKKLLGLLLTMLMIVSLLPAAALATEGDVALANVTDGVENTSTVGEDENANTDDTATPDEGENTGDDTATPGDTPVVSAQSVVVPQPMAMPGDGGSGGNDDDDGDDVDPSSPSPTPVTLSFQLEQKVVVAESADASRVGTNTFKYFLLLECLEGANIDLFFGQSEVPMTYTAGNTNTYGSFTMVERHYDLSMEVVGTETKTQTVTITGSQTDIENIYLEIFEMPQTDMTDWEYGYQFYSAQLGSVTDYDELSVSSYMSKYGKYNTATLPEGADSTSNGSLCAGTYNVYRGYDGQWYDASESNSVSAASFTNTYTGKWKYEGFEVNAWTLARKGWDDTNKEYTWTAVDEINLKDVVFAVYEDIHCTKKLGEFKTDANGNASVTAAEFAADKLPAMGGASALYYLKQISAPADPVHGERPLPTMVWSFEATTTRAADGTITVTLNAPSSVGEGYYDAASKQFQVYNDMYLSIAFDIEKEVSVKNKGVETGKNTFEFLVAVEMEPHTTSDSVKFYFTPEGGERTKIERTSKRTYYAPETESEPLYLVRYYPVSLTVDGEGKAKGTVTLEGWERDMYVTPVVYEKAGTAADWEYAAYMYTVELPTFELTLNSETETYAVLYSDPALTITRHEPSKEGWKSHDDNYYARDGVKTQSATFVNTYLKALPTPAPTATAAPTAAPATTASPAPTAKPQSPKTGDEANLALWLGLAAVNALGLGYVVSRRKREE